MSDETDGRIGYGRDGPIKAAADLERDLRDFASARPEGWNHDDWIRFLEALEARGHDITNREAIGLALERERLGLALSRVKGVGPKRKTALIEKYGNVWTLRNAEPTDIADAAGIPLELAREVKAAM